MSATRRNREAILAVTNLIHAARRPTPPEELGKACRDALRQLEWVLLLACNHSEYGRDQGLLAARRENEDCEEQSSVNFTQQVI
jgi:hypothetical protein